VDLDEFIVLWDKEYLDKLKKIPLFQTDLTSQWNESQKASFAKIFYHLRGHFHDFLWYVGNHAEDKETKDVILKNIAEELNGSARSHEQLYMDFSASLGVDNSKAFLDSTNYLPFAKEFNHSHMKWLHENSADHRFCALSAYERLDNTDYMHLLELVKSLNVDRKGQIFFKIHSVVEHFAPTYEKLKDIWHNSENIVKDSFTFIGYTQLNMWNNLSEVIFNERNT